MQTTVQHYIVHLVDPRSQSLNRAAILNDLQQILNGVAAQRSHAFVLDTRQARSLLVFDSLQEGPMAAGDHSTSASLGAFSTNGSKVRFAGATDCGMNGYVNIRILRLQPPVQNEIWLLLYGQMSGANGPNIRMRIVAYSENGLRTVWMPANTWGTFEVLPTHGGFRIDGTYYRSDRPRHDEYQIARDGVYLLHPRP